MAYEGSVHGDLTRAASHAQAEADALKGMASLYPQGAEQEECQRTADLCDMLAGHLTRAASELRNNPSSGAAKLLQFLNETP